MFSSFAEFSTGLTEVETAIQKNIIAILAKFHPTGVPVRSIWGLYKKQYKSVPTKDDITDNKLKSINHIFERFSQTIMRKSIEHSMNFVLTNRGVDYAEKLQLLPKLSYDIRGR
jgi:DNA-directed RNA polymerase specialized sigma54-like protein